MKINAFALIFYMIMKKANEIFAFEVLGSYQTG